MPPVSNSDQLTGILQGAIQAVFSAGKLGYAGYILLALATIGLFIFGYWLKQQEIKAMQKASDEQAVADQAKNTVDNQKASAQWDQAHATIEQVRSENPDTGKIKRDVTGGTP